MCLAIPGLVESVFTRDGLQMARVNFSGIRRDICVQLTPEAQSGDYVLAHVGLALAIVDKEEAERTLALLEGTGALEELAAHD